MSPSLGRLLSASLMVVGFIMLVTVLLALVSGLVERDAAEKGCASEPSVGVLATEGAIGALILFLGYRARAYPVRGMRYLLIGWIVLLCTSIGVLAALWYKAITYRSAPAYALVLLGALTIAILSAELIGLYNIVRSYSVGGGRSEE